MSAFNLRDWAVGQRILAADLQGHTDRLNELYPLSLSGNVRVQGGGKHGTAAYFPPSPAVVSQPWFPAKITDSLEIDGENNRWQYGWIEQRRTATGWEDLPDGRTGTTDTRFALNMTEANNGATGIMGNSIDHDGADYPAGFSLQPVRGSPVVRMYVSTDVDGNVAYDFEYVNAEDGTCEAP